MSKTESKPATPAVATTPNPKFIALVRDFLMIVTATGAAQVGLEQLKEKGVAKITFAKPIAEINSQLLKAGLPVLKPVAFADPDASDNDPQPSLKNDSITIPQASWDIAQPVLQEMMADIEGSFPKSLGEGWYANQGYATMFEQAANVTADFVNSAEWSEWKAMGVSAPEVDPVDVMAAIETAVEAATSVPTDALVTPETAETTEAAPEVASVVAEADVTEIAEKSTEEETGVETKVGTTAETTADVETSEVAEVPTEPSLAEVQAATIIAELSAEPVTTPTEEEALKAAIDAEMAAAEQAEMAAAETDVTAEVENPSAIDLKEELPIIGAHVDMELAVPSNIEIAEANLLVSSTGDHTIDAFIAASKLSSEGALEIHQGALRIQEGAGKVLQANNLLVGVVQQIASRYQTAELPAETAQV